ncbi:hypothetical protein ACFWNG_27900 [Streptomyces sp. NPDC058391]|uniref:hypothetical protein n=1 Tax=Streptomyces sp. NPDC058391 TaxID=3346476 RepID=UPI00365D8F51
MSSIVKFFVATSEAAVGMLDTGPDASFPLASFGNFDAEEALLEWEARLTGRSFEGIVEEGIPEVVAESEGGPAVILLSDALLNLLVSTSIDLVNELARWWVDEKAHEGMEIDLCVAQSILRELVALIRRERESGEDVYCWTS